MKLLEVGNRMVVNCLQERLDDIAEGLRVDKCILQFSDFDSSEYQVSCSDRENIKVSLKLDYWKTLENDSNIINYLDSLYSDTLATRDEAVEGYNITFNIAIQKLAHESKQQQQNTITKISCLKRNCFAAAFNPHFQAHKQKETSTHTVIPFRPEETMFIRAKSENVVVIFSTIFKDPDDQILAKIFLAEFADAKTNQKSGHHAPPVMFSQDPPLEIKNNKHCLTGEHVYYLTFVLHSTHIKKADNTIDLIHNFRTYLHYHIKCSKAYIHQRMRAKTGHFLQVLNRAKPEKKKVFKYGGNATKGM